MNLTHAAIYSGLTCMSLAVSIPIFEESGKRTGSTFQCATNVLGETTQGGKCKDDGVPRVASSTSSRELTSRSRRPSFTAP